MSFSVYFQWYEGGEASSIPLSVIRSRLGEAIQGEYNWGWQLDYPPICSSDLYLQRSKDDPLAAAGISVNRPCAAAELWSTLYNLLRLSNGVFYFPGSKPIVAHRQSVAHLPGLMTEAIGQPELAFAGSDLLDAVRSLE